MILIYTWAAIWVIAEIISKIVGDTYSNQTLLYIAGAIDIVIGLLWLSLKIFPKWGNKVVGFFERQKFGILKKTLFFSDF